MDLSVKTLKYSEENIKLLKSKGIKKSNVCKPYSQNKVIRYSENRKVYWFSNKISAHMSDCMKTRMNIGTIWLF